MSCRIVSTNMVVANHVLRIVFYNVSTIENAGVKEETNSTSAFYNQYCDLPDQYDEEKWVRNFFLRRNTFHHAFYSKYRVLILTKKNRQKKNRRELLIVSRT